MDNCSIHHIQEVKNILLQAGILLLYLPPYSPDLNPAKELFSYVKYYLKVTMRFYNIQVIQRISSNQHLKVLQLNSATNGSLILDITRNAQCYCFVCSYTVSYSFQNPCSLNISHDFFSYAFHDIALLKQFHLPLACVASLIDQYTRSVAVYACQERLSCRFTTRDFAIIESVDSISRDGPDMPYM